MTIELKTMTTKELTKLLKDVKVALQTAKARDLKEAKKAATKAAAEFGFSLGELSDVVKPQPKTAMPKAKAKKTGTKSPPKYADPSNPSQTWTGKGRQPNWYRTAVENGADPQTLLI